MLIDGGSVAWARAGVGSVECPPVLHTRPAVLHSTVADRPQGTGDLQRAGDAKRNM